MARPAGEQVLVGDQVAFGFTSTVSSLDFLPPRSASRNCSPLEIRFSSSVLLVPELGSPEPAVGVERPHVDVLMTVGPRPVAERVARGGLAVRPDPQDLARQGVAVLGPLDDTSASPVETNRLPSGAKSSRPPLWWVLVGMPVSTDSGSPTLPPARLNRTTRLSELVVQWTHRALLGHRDRALVPAGRLRRGLRTRPAPRAPRRGVDTLPSGVIRRMPSPCPARTRARRLRPGRSVPRARRSRRRSCRPPRVSGSPSGSASMSASMSATGWGSESATGTGWSRSGRRWSADGLAPALGTWVVRAAAGHRGQGEAGGGVQELSSRHHRPHCPRRCCARAEPGRGLGASGRTRGAESRRAH